jgi:hypothetical protein
MATDTEYLQDQSPLNQLQYASKDFPSYFDALLRRIREQYGDEYNDFGSSSVGMLLTHITAYGLSQLSWYLDRTANDCFLETARTLSTVTRLARQIGYKPNPAAASTTDLSLTFASTSAASTIPAGFRFAGPGGLTFLATTDVIVPAGSTSATVNVTEGSYRTVNFTGTGNANQSYRLTGVVDGKYAADQSVRVFVDGLEWTESDFITFDATNQFEVEYTTDPPTVVFGDGFAGNIPPSGSDVRVEYRIISGSSGNVKSGTILSAIDPFVVAGSSVTLTVNNPDGSSGGSEPESIASIKSYAPKHYLSRGAAITQDDYVALVRGFSDPTYGSVSVAYADVIRSLGVDATTQVILSDINTAVQDFESTLSVQDTLIDAEIASLGTSSAAIDAGSASIATEVTNLTADTVAVSASVTSGIGSCASVNGNCAEIQTLADGAIADIAGGSYADATTKLNRIKSLASQSVSAGNSASAALSSIQSSVETMEDSISAQSVASASLTSEAAAIPTFTAAISASVDAISAGASTLDSSIGLSQSELTSHLAGLFSADCKSNLVNVPIMVTDSEGFYSGPSSGMIQAVQTYLDGIKDVTHQVKVVSGSPLLAPADISASVRVRSGFVESEVLANVEFGFDTLLKGRDFAAPLYLSDLYNIVEKIAGVGYVNIEITGPLNRLDAEGNLVPAQLEIVTKGTVTITRA